jgi:hypothetical protein
MRKEHLDVKATKQALQSLAHACRERGLDRAMLDLRAARAAQADLHDQGTGCAGKRRRNSRKPDKV